MSNSVSRGWKTANSCSPPGIGSMEEDFPRGKIAEDSTVVRGRPPARASDRLFGARARADKPVTKTRSASAKINGTGKHAATDVSFEPAANGPHAFNRADELSFKRLHPGVAVLCRVRRVARRQLVLALPHGLTGYCPITQMDVATQKALVSADNDTVDDDDAGHKDGDSASLSTLFTVGQFLSAVIVQVGGELLGDGARSPSTLAKELTGATKDKPDRRIVLSIRPDLVNQGLNPSHLRPGSMVYGCVKSVEEHGYAVNLGIPGMSAFLPLAVSDRSLGQEDTVLSEKFAGQTIFCTIASVNTAANNVTLRCTVSNLKSSIAREPTHTIFSLKPGLLVESKVEKIFGNGVQVSFLAFFKATVHMNHLRSPSHALWANGMTIGDAMNARVLYVDAAAKTIALSAAPFLVKFGANIETVPGPLPSMGIGGPCFFGIRDGTVVDNAVVLRVDVDLGMLIGWDDIAKPPEKVTAKNIGDVLERSAGWGHTAYVHISRISDAKVDHIERLYKPGALVKARILGFSSLEGHAVATVNPSAVEASVFRPSDVKVGATIDGYVDSVLPAVTEASTPDFANGKGVVATVKLGEGVTGFITTLHVADVVPTHSFANARSRGLFLKSVGIVVGQKVTCMVLCVDHKSGRVALSLKPSLIHSKVPQILSISSAKHLLEQAAGASKPLVTEGVVTGLRDSGVIVTFFGGTHGLLPCEDIVAQGLVEESSAQRSTVSTKTGHSFEQVLIPEHVLRGRFSLGQVIKVQVTYVDVARERIRLSASNSARLPLEVAPALEPGAMVDVTITRRDDDARSFEVAIQRGASIPYTCVGRLPFSHLADVGEGTLSEHIQIGMILRGVVILERRDGRDGDRDYLVSCKALLQYACLHLRSAIPSDIALVRPGLFVIGYIASITPFGAFIRFLGGCTGLAPRSKWHKQLQSSDAPPAGSEYAIGQTVMGCIESVSMDEGGAKGRFIVSLYPTTVTKVLPSTVLAESFDPAFAFDWVEQQHVKRSSSHVMVNAMALQLRSWIVVDELARIASGSATRTSLHPAQVLSSAGATIVKGQALHRVVAGGEEYQVTTDACVKTTVSVWDVDSSGFLGGEGVAAAFGCRDLALGELVKCTVLKSFADRPYAVVHMEHKSGKVLGFAAIKNAYDVVGTMVSPGQQLSAIVCQLPTASKRSTVKGVTGHPLSSMVLPMLNSLLLLDAAAAVKPSPDHPAAPLNKSLSSTVPAIELRVGMEVSAFIRSAAEGKVMESLQELSPYNGFVADIPMRLTGVDGRYDAWLSFAETIDVDPLTGLLVPKDDLFAAYKAVVHAKAGTRFRAKIVAITEQAKGTSPLLRVQLTVRSIELSLPNMHLACLRPNLHPLKSETKAAEGPCSILTDATVIAASAATLGNVGGGGMHGFTPSTLLPLERNCVVLPGAYAFGVVEGHSEDGSFVWVGLGAALRVRVYCLDCGDTDDVRSSTTGLLCCTQTAASKLGNLSLLHPLGSVVPIVISSVADSAPGRRLISASIRLARAAMAQGRSGAAVQPAAKKLRTEGLSVQSFHAYCSSIFKQIVEVGSNVPDVGPVLCCVAPTQSMAKSNSHTEQYQRFSVQLKVQLDNQSYGLVDITHSNDASDWESFPFAAFRVGQVVLGTLLPSAGESSHRSVSLRPSMLQLCMSVAPTVGAKRPKSSNSNLAQTLESALQREAEDLTDSLAPGTPIRGYVVHISKDNVHTVKLSPALSVTVDSTEVSDKAVAHHTVFRFPLAKVVSGKILHLADPPSATLRTAEVHSRKHEDRLLQYRDIHAGMQLAGTVTKVADFGVFVALDNTNRHGRGSTGAQTERIPGLCHHSEVADAVVSKGALSTKFQVGDKVRVVVLAVDVAKRQLSLTMKPSKLVEPLRQAESDIDTGDACSEPDSDDLSHHLESASSSEEVASGAGAAVTRGIFSHLDHRDDDEPMRQAFAPRTSAPKNRVDVIVEENGDEYSDADPIKSRAAQKRAQKRAAAAAEEEVRRKEGRIASGEAESNPETEEEFERLVAGHPNDSLAWIRYMAWQLSVAELNKARAVAERALSMIGFRHEQQKLNMWTAFMNMEATYGDQGSLAAVFARAQAAAAPKAVHYALLGIYQRLGSERVGECEALFTVTARKFGRDFKRVWVEWAAFRFRQNDIASARSLLQRALLVLPKRKHVETITQFALLEYKFSSPGSTIAQEYGLGLGSGGGSAERGRTMFENLLATCAKRVDIWSIYLDQEMHAVAAARDPTVKAELTASVRALFDRILTMKFSSKKMRFFFKKYVSFEQLHGDSAGVAKVAAAARAYVAAQVGGGACSDSELT